LVLTGNKTKNHNVLKYKKKKKNIYIYRDR